MGHKRTPFLPKTRKWRDIVEAISDYHSNTDTIPSITYNTLENVKSRFVNIENDKGVNAAFKFLIYLSFANKLDNPSEFLKSRGIEIEGRVTPLRLSKVLNNWLNEYTDSAEYLSLAKSAIVDSLSHWYSNHNVSQEKLFDLTDNYEVWRKTSDGAGFCEISRIYFSKFIERYLKYFLEREASGNISSLSERIKFNDNLEKYIESISQHSFETSKITQSFSAGWFNKNVAKEIPSDKKIRNFISYSFAKIRLELSKEQSND